MPKQPKVRPSYEADGQFLLRLAHAIEQDQSRPAEWRQDVTTQVTLLAYRLILAPPPDKATNGQGKETRQEAQNPQKEAQEGQDAKAPSVRSEAKESS